MQINRKSSFQYRSPNKGTFVKMEDLSGSLKKLIIESDLQLSEMKRQSLTENAASPP